MKKEKILKIMLVVIMGVILMAMSLNVYGLTDDDLELNLTNTTNTTGGTIDLTPTVNNNTDNTNTNTNTGLTNTNTNSANTNTNNYDTSLPEAGVAENTVMGIVLTVLAIVAVYAYRKIKYYKNI